MSDRHETFGQLLRSRCAVGRIVLVLVLAGVTLAARAADGRVMLFRSVDTAITQPGHYVLTRDILLAAGEEVRIEADDVTLDLNGHAISKSPGVGGIVVRIASGVGVATIRNGRISGGDLGISYLGSPANRGRLRVERVEIRNVEGEGILLHEVENAEVISCRIVDVSGTAIAIQGVSDEFTGRIADNVILSSGGNGILLFGLRAGEVVGNIVRGHGVTLSARGIWLDGVGSAGGNRIEGNTVTGGGGDGSGILIDQLTTDNLVLRNVVAGNGREGIRVLSGGNVVAGNVVQNNGLDGIVVEGSHSQVLGNEIVDNTGDGIFISGSWNLVRGNFSSGSVNGYGIEFDTTAGHAYRDNVLLGNSLGAVGGAGAGDDAGGNVP